MPERLRRLVVLAELPAVVLIAPALLFPTPARLVVLVVVPLIWLAARAETGRALPSTPLNAALLVLLTMAAASLAVTPDVAFSLGKVAGVVLGALLFWAVARWLTTYDRLRVMVGLFVLAGVGLAVIGLLGALDTSRHDALAAVTSRLPVRIRGVPGAEAGFNPNAVSGCLVIFLPVQIAVLAATLRREAAMERRIAPRWTLAAQVPLIAVTAGTLLLMQSRGAWLGLFVAGLLSLACVGRLGRLLAGVGLTAAVIIALLFGSALEANRVIGKSGAGVSDTLATRSEIWAWALRGIEAVPFTGLGMNVFRRAMGIVSGSGEVPRGTDLAHAHNHLLQAALDVGVPGLVAYLAVWLVTATLLIAVYRHASSRTERTLAGGFGAGLAAHFVFGVTDAIPLGAKVGVLFWITLALCVGLHKLALPAVRHGEAGGSWPRSP